MESMSKKSRSCESNDGIEDRLSGLPDELIVHILSLMPTLDAVRTMLIQRFRNLWTLVPALSFENYGRISRMADKPPSTHVASSSFACFVQNALLLNRRSTIDTFRLCICNSDKKSTDAIIGDVRMWLRYAIEREVKDLYFRYEAPNFDLPGCVFTSQYLVTLTLARCMLKHYEHQSQLEMINLRKLSLLHVYGSTKAFDQLISGCPCLQELIIITTFGQRLSSLNINSPSVRKLYLHMYNTSCTLNCPSLNNLDISICGILPIQLNIIGVISLQEVNFKDLPRDCDSGEINAYFRQFQNAELISLSCKSFEKISSVEKMEFAHSRWKRIVLHPQWDCERCLEVICMLMKSSINLEELIIYAGESSGSKCELVCPKLYTCVLPLLKTVTIHGNHGYENWCKGQLQVIQFLLRNAVVLDKLVITLGKSELTTAEELDLIKQVSTFRRASADATVIFA
ncbi:F-box/LRR-repeat protein At3g26922-like [Silene latifolia]|uniref:F-box/LRR-repeat protein At3g26922-like n=1 Tax=Silene latifolia TaxID=37657 RepID=UPI003D77C397